MRDFLIDAFGTTAMLTIARGRPTAADGDRAPPRRPPTDRTEPEDPLDQARRPARMPVKNTPSKVPAPPIDTTGAPIRAT